MAKKTQTFAISDRVAYSAAFLRSTGQVTGNKGAMRGTIIDAGDPSARYGYTLIRIKWDGGHENSVLACNLALVKRIAIDAALADRIPENGFRKLVKI